MKNSNFVMMLCCCKNFYRLHNNAYAALKNFLAPRLIWNFEFLEI